MIKMENMTWTDISQAIQNGFDEVLFTVGAIEQHGPHLPISSDSDADDVIGEIVAHNLGNTLQAPTIRVGCSDHHLKFSGTISLKKSTLKDIVSDYIHSLSLHGFKTIIIIPLHGGNFEPLKELKEEIKGKFKSNIIILTDLITLVKVTMKASQKKGIPSEEAGAHAGETETSIMLYLKPQYVRMERAQRGFVGNFDKKIADKIFKGGIGCVSNIGVLGDPTKAKAEWGKEYIEDIAENITSIINRELKMIENNES